MSEDEPPEEQTFKQFQFGDTRPVVLPDQDADVLDAVNTYHGLREAERTAHLPENEQFVSALEEAFRKGRGHLQKVFALKVLAELLEELQAAVDRLAEGDGVDEETIRESRVLKLEDGAAVEVPSFDETVEAWKDDPPELTKEVAADFLEEAD